MKRFSVLFAFVLGTLFLSGCLTVEKKEYTFELKDNNSGTLTIRFINIMSMKDDTMNVSSDDFNELLTGYLNGNEIEMDYQNATIRSKRLYEEDGKLCGEVIIDYNDLAAVGLYQYDSKCPYMFNVGSFLESETYQNSNGDFGGDIMPVVFWPKTLNSLTLTSYVTEPDESTVSLLDAYHKWQ